jgi:hypothetical protein
LVIKTKKKFTIKQPPYRGMQTADVRRFSSTPRIANGGLLVVHMFALRIITRVPGQVIALNSATAHTRKRYSPFKIIHQIERY